MPKLNGTGDRKVALRQIMMRRIDAADPFVVETHGGAGYLFRRCYAHVSRGVVIDRDGKRTSFLARQRPTWSVFEGDTEAIIAAGALAHLPVRVLDVDPFGDPWPVLRAFFSTWRETGPISVVVNDGLRQKAKRGASFRDRTLGPLRGQWGGDLYGRYLEVVESLMRTTAGDAGFRVSRWAAYNATPDIAHYLAELEPA